MSIASGFTKMKNYILTSSGYKLLSRWTSSQTVHMGDGSDDTDTVEYRFGAMKGITSSLATDNDGFALSASAGKNLQDQCTQLNQSLTEKINALVQKLHPVGSWYFSTVATNPVDIFGFGTWQLITDRFLVGAGASYFPGAMGGEAVHTLTAAELPTHQHNVLSGTLGGNNGNYKFMLSSQSMYGTYDGQYGVITDDRFITAASSAYCGNQPHNNMPPYYAIYMWVRTA